MESGIFHSYMYGRLAVACFCYTILWSYASIFIKMADYEINIRPLLSRSFIESPFSYVEIILICCMTAFWRFKWKTLYMSKNEQDVVYKATIRLSIVKTLSYRVGAFGAIICGLGSMFFWPRDIFEFALFGDDYRAMILFALGGPIYWFSFIRAWH